MASQQLNPGAIVALKEALTNIYWYKRDLRTFLSNTLKDPTILGGINWDDYKRNIVDRVVSYLVKYQDRYQDELTNLISAVAGICDFSHLKRLENGDEKVRLARDSVSALKKYTSGHETLYREKEKAEERRKSYSEQVEKASSFRDRLDNLRNEFAQLVTSREPQQRGYKLEELLKQLFDLFDLDPRASFRIQGEQIDGSFTLEGIDFLFEAKWQNQLMGAESLDSFAAKVLRKLDNTLGLFLSVNGFSSDAVMAHKSGRRVLLLMDGSDLMAVLEGRIDLKDFLLRKRRHASQTGEIFLRYQDLL
jgi:hypothetical protein